MKHEDEQLELSEDVAAIITDIVEAEALYDYVVSLLKIDQGDDFRRIMMKNLVRQETKEHIMGTVLLNMNDDQIKQFQEFQDSTLKMDPERSFMDLVLAFGLMHPDIEEAVHKHLGEFFVNFVTDFNAVKSAQEKRLKQT